MPPTARSPQNSLQAHKTSGNTKVLSVTTVKIELYQGDDPAATISSSTENDGIHAWTVDPSLVDGSDYRIRISCAADASVYGESASIKIEQRSVAVSQPVAITYWTKGQTADITWTSTGAIPDVKIDLYKDGSLQQTIVSSAPNSGSYTWGEVATSLGTAGGYKIRVSSAAAPGVYAESEEFHITHGYELFAMWGSEGTGDGQFNYPQGIAIDGSGNVYVSDQNRIQKFTPNGTFLTKWGSPGDGDGQFSHPCGMAIDSLGYVYVADCHNYRIQKFTSDGTFVLKWGSYGQGDGQFDLPYGVAVDSFGFVYVSDLFNHRIQKFTSDGTFVSKWGSLGAGDGQFNYPRGLAIDGSGYIYVPDYHHRVQKFTLDGAFVSTWGGEGDEDGQFRNPLDVAVDDSGGVYVVDGANHRIQKFTSDGIFMTKWGSLAEYGEHYGPRGMKINGSGYAYVIDYGNSCVQVFRPVHD